MVYPRTKKEEREKMKTAYTAFKSALNIEENDVITDDHINGENGLYRLAAYIPRNTNETPSDVVEFSHFLKDILTELPIRPNRLFIHDDCYAIDWAAVGCQVLSSRAQYVQLLENFSKFLEEDYFCQLNIQVQLGSLSDSPSGTINDFFKKDINYSPTFNPECFGNKGDIEVICLASL